MDKKDGFTIIEVALVLGIAGMIFAAVFIALPQLLANERDARRRDDMMKFTTNLKNFQTNNNRGSLPGNTGNDKITLDNDNTLSIDGGSIAQDRANGRTNADATSWAGFYRDFFDNTYEDPDGSWYNLVVANCGKNAKYSENCNNGAFSGLNGAGGVDHNIYIAIGAKCGEANDFVKTSNNRNFAVIYKLERGGQYCYNS